jgi:hypothetical protein
MRFTIVRLLSVIIICIHVSGCKKDHIVSQGQKIFFQQDYVNYAWGYQHYGFIIDSDGNVMTYDKPEKWNFPDKSNNLTEIQVNENMSSCKPTGKKIPRTELQKYINYISYISLSKVTAPKHVGSDMGSLGYYCYQFSEISSTYKVATIKTEGDLVCENLNFYSKRVVAWMKDISLSISR